MIVTGFGNTFAADKWVKIAPADLATGDVVVIVDLNSSRAMSNDKGTSAAPTAKEVTLSSDKTQIGGTVDENIQWTVRISDDGYQFFATEKTWMYCISNNNGLRVGINSTYNFFSIKTVNVNNVNRDFLYNNYHKRYIGVYNEQEWRSYTTSPNNSQSNIKNTVTAFFKKVSGTDANLTSITLSGNYPTVFNVGDEFSHAGMTVTANYDDETSENVTSSASFSGYNMNASGTQTVTVSYGGKTATYDITVSAIPVTGITLNTNEAEIEVGQTLQLTATVAPENATNKEYSWSSSNEGAATVDENGLVSAIAAGPATITVTTTDGGKTATCNVTVKAKEGIWYSLVTSTDNLDEGDKVIIVNTNNKRAMSTTQNTNNRSATDVNIVSGKAFVPKNGNIQVLTLEGNNDGWYFNTGSGYLYAASSSENQLKTKSDKDDNAKATITIDDGATSVVFQGTNSHNVLQNNGTIFSCYVSASQSPVDIYKLDDEKQDAELSFSEESVTINVSEIDAFVSPTFNNPNNLTVTATSTDESVAVFDVETSKIVLNGSLGTAEITVTSAATDEFRAGVASITVTVKKTETAVSFAESVVEITYGDNYNKQAATTEGVSGNLVYTSSDVNIVKFHGNNVIDVLGPGTVTITATAPATETTEESSATYTLKIYEPADPVVGTEELLNESFDDCDGSYPLENIWWGSGSSYKDLPERLQLLGWTTSNNTPAGKGCLKVGTTSDGGYAKSPSFVINGTTLLAFDIAPWLSSTNTHSINTGDVTVSLINAAGQAKLIDTFNTNTLTPWQFNHKEYEINGIGEEVTIEFKGSYTCFFLDNVVVGGGAQPAHEINLTFSSAGYLTWVATADIDFSQTEGVTAYQITEATPQGITAEEVQKAPKGAAVMLKGSGTKTLKRTTEEVADLSDNKMQACTNGSVNGMTGSATSTDIYVLGNGNKGLGFYMLSGTLQAGKGYLNISGGAGAKPSFIAFEETTDISNAAVETTEDDGAYYNLQGVRVMNPQKGIYIKNGKKIVVK